MLESNMSLLYHGYRFIDSIFEILIEKKATYHICRTVFEYSDALDENWNFALPAFYHY